MSFQLDSDEPEGGPWRAKLLTAVTEALVQLGEERAKGGRGVVLAVDGRSSSGKTTLAARLQDVVAGSAVVQTDDIGWWHSRFGWDDLLIDSVLVPVHRGEHVRFRPPRWAEHGRQGYIEVPARCPLLIIEGVGAGRSEVSHLIDALVWVQADQQEADRRSLARVGQPGGSRTVGDHREWMAEEEPFLAGRRTWERADMLVAGTPQIPFDPALEVVVAPWMSERIALWAAVVMSCSGPTCVRVPQSRLSAHCCFKAAHGIVVRNLTCPSRRAQYQKGKLLRELFVTLKDTFW